MRRVTEILFLLRYRQNVLHFLHLSWHRHSSVEITRMWLKLPVHTRWPLRTLDDPLSICLKLRHVRFIAPSLTFLWAHNTQARVLLILHRALYTRLLVTVNHRRSISQHQTPIVIIVIPLTLATIAFLLFKHLHLFFLLSCRTSFSLLRFLQHRRLLRRLNFLRSKRVKILHLLVPCSLAHGETVVAQMSIPQLLIYGV